MKKSKKLLIIALIFVTMGILCTTQTFALTESEVQQQVDSVGKEAVTGNVFIWFLCAVGFLKISQKIDSFLSSLGINVGNTGGSMLAEAMIAARTVMSVGHHGGAKTGNAGSASNAGFMSGGLAGVVGRNITNSAVKNATDNGSGGLGGKAFASSMSKGGSFANRAIGTVATGNISSMGSMTGEKAAAALSSYMGYTALGPGAEDVPAFSNVEIGGGRITATEKTSDCPEGIEFGMYHTEQYTAPTGNYSTVMTADGTTWYKQYAADTVEKTPYKDSDGSIAYRESIVKRLPDPPKRKDRI